MAASAEDVVLAAVRDVLDANPDAGAKKVVALVKAANPDLNVGSKEVKQAIKALKEASAGAEQVVAVSCEQNSETGMRVDFERRDAGEGRGMGAFVLKDCKKGAYLLRVRPSLSVVFDHSAHRICGFCFAHGKDANIEQCGSCEKFATCSSCRDWQRGEWHQAECRAFTALPPGAKQGGDTSVLRMLLRYKTTRLSGDWCDVAQEGKEPVRLIDTLQANKVDIPAQTLQQLSRVTGVDEATVSTIIFQIRTNAAAIDRGGKAGCALCVHMGYTNHSCDPNAVASVDVEGKVTLKSKRALQAGEEILISYVDPKWPRAQRQAVLSAHYGFTCACTRCT